MKTLKIGRRFDDVFETSSCRCTVCLTVFIDEELELLADEDGFFKGCGICKTDAHLVDVVG